MCYEEETEKEGKFVLIVHKLMTAPPQSFTYYRKKSER